MTIDLDEVERLCKASSVSEDVWAEQGGWRVSFARDTNGNMLLRIYLDDAETVAINLKVAGYRAERLCRLFSDAAYRTLLPALAKELRAARAVVEATRLYTNLRDEIRTFPFHGQQVIAAQTADEKLASIGIALAAYDAVKEGP
jgi:hypothetical protein